MASAWRLVRVLTFISEVLCERRAGTHRPREREDDDDVRKPRAVSSTSTTFLKRWGGFNTHYVDLDPKFEWRF